MGVSYKELCKVLFSRINPSLKGQVGQRSAVFHRVVSRRSVLPGGGVPSAVPLGQGRPWRQPAVGRKGLHRHHPLLRLMLSPLPVLVRRGVLCGDTAMQTSAPRFRSCVHSPAPCVSSRKVSHTWCRKMPWSCQCYFGCCF